MGHVQLEDSFYGSRKLRRLASTLGVSVPLVAGHLALLWSWALVSEPEGELTDYDATELEAVMLWEGERGALYRALLDEREPARHRFLDRTDSGAVLIHDWAEYRASRSRERIQRAEIRGWRPIVLKPEILARR